MPMREPYWWYGHGSSAMPRLLSPLSTLYAKLAARRIAGTEPYRSSLPVVCVGNFTAGGTGKTPLTLHIARLLIAHGEHPVILTRGYGGRRAGPCWIVDGTELAEDVGDEPLLLSRAAPTMIARDRRAGAMAIEQGPVPAARLASVILMDDGLQNPSLAKDLTIAVVDAVRGFGNGLVMPSGPLRASLDLQLRLADAVVVNTPPGSAASSAAVRTSVAAMLAREFPGAMLEARAEAATTEHGAAFAGQQVVAFAGIANPERFYALVEQQGGHILARQSFADHHAYSETDADELLRLAAGHGARLVTTEKDHVRLVGYGGAREQLAKRTAQLAIRLSFSDADETRLQDLLFGALAARRAATDR